MCQQSILVKHEQSVNNGARCPQILYLFSRDVISKEFSKEKVSGRASTLTSPRVL